LFPVHDSAVIIDLNNVCPEGEDVFDKGRFGEQVTVIAIISHGQAAIGKRPRQLPQVGMDILTELRHQVRRRLTLKVSRQAAGGTANTKEPATAARLPA
jgi:hypothetical protein